MRNTGIPQHPFGFDMRLHHREQRGRRRFGKARIDDPLHSGRAGGVDHCLMLTDPLRVRRSEEHTSELQSLMRISYAVFCLKKQRRSTVAVTDVLPVCTLLSEYGASSTRDDSCFDWI